ncbi:MAG: hypothetical protein LUG57_04520 [Oscillospiraceae bacterium]|nr:hypothetical protein [Oscillospiraceae bacterium]
MTSLSPAFGNAKKARPARGGTTGETRRKKSLYSFQSSKKGQTQPASQSVCLPFVRSFVRSFYPDYGGEFHFIKSYSVNFSQNSPDGRVFLCANIIQDFPLFANPRFPKFHRGGGENVPSLADTFVRLLLPFPFDSDIMEV